MNAAWKRVIAGILLASSSACDGGGACAFNSDCAAGSFCRDGACVTECSSTMPCSSGQACTSFGQCVATDASAQDDAGTDAGTRDAGTDAGTRDAGTDAGADDAGIDGGPACGDGRVEGAEECDDGNSIDGDGCEASCTWTCETDAECGDGDPCNGADACVDHVCTVGAALALGASCETSSLTGGVCRAGVCSARCDPTAAFGEPRLADVDTDGYDEGGFLSADERTIYFSSTRSGGAGGWDLWFATRTAVEAPFGVPSPVPGVNTADNERYPHLTEDGLFLYVESGGGSVYSVLWAGRASTSEPFGALELHPALNGDGNDSFAYPLADHRAIYFNSDRGSSSDIYRVSRAGGTLGTPVLVPAVDVNTAGQESNPVLTQDELTLYFTALSRAGGAGDWDIWVAQRSSSADPFGPATNLGAPINTAAGEWPTWISADGCALYYTAVRPNGAGDSRYDILVATREP